jgi:sulfur transfer protein SufE
VHHRYLRASEGKQLRHRASHHGASAYHHGALTAQRSNGLASMLARIEGDARVAAQA